MTVGSEVTLSLDDVEDWMFSINRKVYGGFTVQAMRSEMSPGEQKRHDRAWRLNFPPADRVNLVPNRSYKENSPGFVARLFGAKAEEAPPGDILAEHPMSENMGPGIGHAIDANPDTFLKPGPDGMTMLHNLTLGGSLACVRVLLEKGANPADKTKHGHTALQLAELMGWPKLEAILREAESRA